MTGAQRTFVRTLTTAEVESAAPMLAELFVDAVDDGASIGYLADLDRPRAEAYWRALADSPGGRSVIVAEDGEGIAGVVILAPMQHAFQPHRAEIFKLVVHRRARGRGIGAALMREAEAQALALGRTMLTLMTRGGSDGERLYTRLGWTRAGILPDDSLRPDGTLCDAVIFYKRLR